MSRRSAKQFLAFITLLGFAGVSLLVLLWPEHAKVDLVFGAWIGLATKVLSDYFGDTQPEHEISGSLPPDSS